MKIMTSVLERRERMWSETSEAEESRKTVERTVSSDPCSAPFKVLVDAKARKQGPLPQKYIMHLRRRIKNLVTCSLLEIKRASLQI